MALRKTNTDIIRDDDFRLVIKSHFCGIDLGEDKSFKTQYENFRNCRFDDYLNELKTQYNYPSNSEVLIFYNYIENKKNKKIFMHYKSIASNLYSDELAECDSLSEEEILEKNKLIEEGFNFKIIKNLGVTATVETTFFKNMPLYFGEFEDEEEDEITEPIPYVGIEVSFIHEKCSVCLDLIPNILLIPCLHIALCNSCDVKGRFVNCPVCRKEIERKIIIGSQFKK